MSRVLLAGGYGVFGGHVARELARGGLELVVAGRDRERADGFAAALGPGHRGLGLDLARPDDCRRALSGMAVAIDATGSRQSALPEACLEAGVHHLDISEDRRHAAAMRALGPRFQARGLAAVYGASSLPSISGALAARARAAGPAAATPRAARVVLFIGNDNPKGTGAVSAAAALAGRRFAAPQGELVGFRGAAAVALPPPFGRRTVRDLESPDLDLLPERLGVSAVRVQVGFELGLTGALLGLLARGSSPPGPRLVALVAWLAGRAPRVGNSAGLVLAELTWADGSLRRALVLAASQGQRMAALPCALAARALVSGAAARGALTADELLGPEALLDGLAAQGFPTSVESSDAGLPGG